LRVHAARGTVINSAFQIGLYGLGTIQKIVVAAWLTRAQYGLWGVLLSALMALVWIKSFGIADKYVQQSEPDQELAFQKAFTIEVALSAAFFALACLALPIYAIAYGRPQIIVAGIVLATAVPLTAFEAPVWIPYRLMQYGRQRILSSVDPVIAIALSITLTSLGMGYWGLIVAAVIGSAAGGLACCLTCPYRLCFRLDWSTVKTYANFSWPLVGFGLCGFVTLQATLLAANHAVGLAGIGAIGLASTITGMSDGIDGIVSQTIYPVVCAVADRTRLLSEAFVKSNRVALMWAMPAMVGVALFAGDLVHFVIGDRWRPDVPLITAVALTCGLAQVGFNWEVFLRAVNKTRPIFIAALAEVGVVLSVSIPAMLAFGLTGYAVGVGAVRSTQILIRAYYMRSLFGDFSALKQLWRAVLPTLPATAVVLATRAITHERSLAMAVAELATYAALVTASTLLFEQSLVVELVGYLRRAQLRSRGMPLRSSASTQ
jgi:O-antigen/teichoic acid export membrane protein